MIYKPSKRIFGLSIFIYTFILISLFKKSIQEKKISLIFPSSLQLIDNNEILVVANDGIHFYNQNFTFENISKKIELSLLAKKEDNEKVSMAQFSDENGGYILIIIKDMLFILNREGEQINSTNITEKEINGTHYGLTPYKNNENILYFIISYIQGSFIFLIKCKYNLEISQIEIKDKKIELSGTLTGIYCLFMNPLKSFEINNKILTCFYTINNEIISHSFDPEKDYNEINNLRYSKIITLFNYSPFYINAITNTNKTKALIYIIFETKPFWMTFDFTNKFSNVVSEFENGIYLTYEIYKHKIFYFTQTDEFVIISAMDRCEKFIMVFNNKFILNYKGILNFKNGCSYTDSFSIFYDGTNYTIITDGGSNEGFLKSISEIENIQYESNNDEESLQMENSQNLNEDYLFDIKCKEYDKISKSYGLCISCNEEKLYFEAKFKNDSFLHGYKECYNQETKPINFYLDSLNNTYKPCYETCRTCNEGGNGEKNNCITCDNNYIKKPGYPNDTTTNCVVQCLYSYYYTSYGQYKCTDNSNCPEEANLYIRDLKKCTDDCNKEKGYEFQYGGQCLKNCPKYTKENENNICIDIEVDSCSKSEVEIDMQEFLNLGGVELRAKYYANEFGYTKKHISRFYNTMFNIIIYKDSICIDDLAINIPKIDFGNCLIKAQNSISNYTNDNIIIVLAEILNAQKKSTTSYAFFNPKTGEKLPTKEICKDEEIIIKESVISQLNNSAFDLNSILFLTQQNINIFNLSDEFYTNICYNFESPNGKDVPLRDRIHSFYPNITLCDEGCINKGVNLTSMESICLCKFNDLIRNEFIEDNAILSNTLGEITEIISNSNLDVLKCYENVFKIKFIKKGYGGFIIFSIIFFEIILSLIFIFYDINMIRKYLYNLTNYYLYLISDKKKNISLNNVIKNTRFLTVGGIYNPPKKILKREKSQKNLKVSIHFKTGTFHKKRLDTNSRSLSLQKSESAGKLLKYSSSKDLRKFKKFNLFNYEEVHKRKKQEILKAKNNCGNINMEEYLKPDVNDMDYDDAIKFDKRKFFEYLIDKLKERQIILDIFFNKENLRPMTIKMMLFLLNVDLYFVINGLFFNEIYISELFNSTEEETFFSYFPRSIDRLFYSTLVGVIIGIIIDCIFVEEKKIKRIFIREKEDPMELKYQISINIKSIKKRYTIFIFLCFFISIISWYYVSCFNNSYPGVKIEWIKSSITIIIIFQILSIIMAILDSILREISFRFESEKAFKLKQLLS